MSFIQLIFGVNFVFPCEHNFLISYLLNKLFLAVLLQVKISIPKAIEGKDLNISCLVQGGEMVKSFRWKVNGTLLENETMQQLLIMNVNRSMVEMVYSCSATPYKGVESQESMATIQKVYGKSWFKLCFCLSL